MKFKATLEDARVFAAVLQVCRSIQKVCIVRLQSVSTRFFTGVEAVDAGVQVWVRCRTDRLFSDFRCLSQYKEQSITCEVLDMSQLEHICRRADLRDRGGGRAFRTVIRLARNGAQPVFKIAMHGLEEQPDLSYDVPVRILSDAEIEQMRVPPLEQDRMQVVLPHLLEMTTFIDKLRTTACESVTFRATRCLSAQSSGSAAANGVQLTSAAGMRNSNKTITTAAGTHENSKNNADDDAKEREDGGRSGAMMTTDTRDTTDEVNTQAKASLRVSAEHMFAQFCLHYDAIELIEQPPQQNGRSDASAEDECSSSSSDDEDGNGNTGTDAWPAQSDGDAASHERRHAGNTTTTATKEQGHDDRSEHGSLPQQQRHVHDRSLAHRKGATRRRRIERLPDCTDASVTVNVRRFARFLSTVKELNPPRVSLYLVHQRALVLSAYALSNTTMVAYIPVQAYA